MMQDDAYHRMSLQESKYIERWWACEQLVTPWFWESNDQQPVYMQNGKIANVHVILQYQSARLPRVLCIFLVRSWTVLSLSTLPTWCGFLPRLTLISMVVSVFLVLIAIALLRRFLHPILDPLVFVPNTFYTHNLSIYGLIHNWFTHMLWLKLKPRDWTKTMFSCQNRLFHKALFYTKTVLYIAVCRLAG